MGLCGYKIMIWVKELICLFELIKINVFIGKIDIIYNVIYFVLYILEYVFIFKNVKILNIFVIIL